MQLKDRLYPVILGVARTLWWFQGIQFSVRGAHHIPADGGAVIVINHTGYLDFTFAGLPARSSKRLIRFMAKEDVFRHPVMGPLMRGMHHIPVDRSSGNASYQAAVEYLKSGELIGIFPEATISQSFELKAFKTGAVRMAADASTPVIPLVIWGSQRVWTKSKPKALGRHRFPIYLAVGEPIVIDPAADPAAETERVKVRMNELLAQLQADYEREHGPFGGGEWWLPRRLGGSAPTLAEAAGLERQEKAARAEKSGTPARPAKSGDAESGPEPTDHPKPAAPAADRTGRDVPPE